MKKKLYTTIVLCLIVLLPAGYSQTMTRNPAVSWEDLPLIRSGVKMRTFISSHPAGFGLRGNVNFPAKEKDGSYQLGVHMGKPGMLTYIYFNYWQSSAENWGDLNLFFDDLEKPAYSGRLNDFFFTFKFPHLAPLWGHHDRERWGFPCLPFNFAFKATRNAAGFVYQIGLHLYREPRFSEALDSVQIHDWNEKLKQPVGAYPGNDKGDSLKTGKVEIAPSAFKTIFESHTSGVIRSIRLSPPLGDDKNVFIDNCYIRIIADGDTTAYLPLSMFFMGFLEAPFQKFKSIAAGFDGNYLYCYFPMPYWQSVRIELESRLIRPFSFPYEIRWSTKNSYSKDKAGKFYVKYNLPSSVHKGDLDFQHVNVKGSGHLVGFVGSGGRWIESNFRAYVDGSKTISFEAAGRSNYFCQSFTVNENLQTKLHGGLLRKTVGYRLHLVDYIPFQSSLVFSEGNTSNFIHDTDADYTSAVFYYYNPIPGIIITDSLDVGDPYSEKEHGYEITGSRSRLQKDNGSYEANYYLEFFDDDGRWTDGTTRFRVHIDPENDGVRLRKRINQKAHHQKIRVYVDGKDAGIWFEQGTNYLIREKNWPQGWAKWPDPEFKQIYRDTEFEIPAELTRNKSEIQLSMETIDADAVNPADKGLTNEYFYWVYCYKMR